MRANEMTIEEKMLRRRQYEIAKKYICGKITTEEFKWRCEEITAVLAMLYRKRCMK